MLTLILLSVVSTLAILFAVVFYAEKIKVENTLRNHLSDEHVDVGYAQYTKVDFDDLFDGDVPDFLKRQAD